MREDDILSRVVRVCLEDTNDTSIVSGKLLFTQSDLIKGPLSSNALDTIIRMMCVKLCITTRTFATLHAEYCVGVLGIVDSRTITSDRNNLRRAVQRGNITISMFQKAIAVLGYPEITEVNMSFKSVHGDQMNISTEDAKRLQSGGDDE